MMLYDDDTMRTPTRDNENECRLNVDDKTTHSSSVANATTIMSIQRVQFMWSESVNKDDQLHDLPVVFSLLLSKDMSSQAYETIFASVQLFPRILHVQYVLRRTSVDLVLHVTIDNVSIDIHSG